MHAVLLADLHLHHLPTWRLKWCETFVDDLLAGFSAYDKPLHLYVLGDALEIRDKVDSRVLNLLIKLLKEWRHGDVVWISGQHDSYVPGKATLHNLDAMKIENGHIHVVDNDVFKHGENYFVPFQRRVEDYREKLAQVPDGVVVLTHIPTVEIIEMYGAKDVEGISVKEFARFKKAVSGDIHKYYDFEHLSYVGAPSQRDFRDKGVDGQIGYLKGDKLIRLPVDHPKHIEVSNASEIPEEGEYIVRTKRGSNIEKSEKVIGLVEVSAIDIDSVKLKTSGTLEQKIDQYLSRNTDYKDREKAKLYATSILSEI